jgi:hypothetical protein
MISVKRNQQLAELAAEVTQNPELKAALQRQDYFTLFVSHLSNIWMLFLMSLPVLPGALRFVFPTEIKP